uniref:Sec-independent protein translocase protein TatA n=1 Tax=Candidatus Desulfatibia profunda TaxID=2841695 RepID=A0A8J6TKT2_9BACT|nr:twin-arginine translocase TatA/TatE family subunit [Candidatus Desulfatibia profunda]
MFGIGMPEMLLILAVALIVIGPKKLPDLAKSLGRAFAEFKRATAEIKETMEIDKNLTDIKKAFEDIDEPVRGEGPVKGGYETVNAKVADHPDEKQTETKSGSDKKDKDIEGAS